MMDVVSAIDMWLADGERVAIAGVIGIEESGPRDPGATMAVNEDGEGAGWVRRSDLATQCAC
jgi:xanthine dehydrogenase accessory factor